MIVPVWVSSEHHPGTEQLVYALLDTQSDTVFIDEDVSNSVKAKFTPIRLRLTTMLGKDTVMPSKRVTGLKIRGYNSAEFIELPPAYTKDCIPVNRSHIPTCDTARQWNHLVELVNEIPPQLDCEVGLLIGYSCSKALAPRQVILGGENEPYAVRTALGWSIVGPTVTHTDNVSSSTVCHRVSTKELPVVTPADALKILNSDFKDENKDESSVSQDDILFLKTQREKIRFNNSPQQRRYVPSDQNPADIASRGSSASELITSDWFKGSQLLWKKEITPATDIGKDISLGDPEVKKVQVRNTLITEHLSLSDRLKGFSSWYKATQSIARLIRLVKRDKTTNHSTVQERGKAQCIIQKDLQATVYAEEIRLLKKGKSLSHKSKLYKIDAFLNSDGLLKVGGRMKHAAFSSSLKHPVIVPKNHHITQLLIGHFHNKVQHQGKGRTINEIRLNRFWIPYINKTVASVLHHCVKGRNQERNTEEQRMADHQSD
ncbi:unnamed protein product [Knipowitschia caucasica]